jgi:hypothetical protein
MNYEKVLHQRGLNLRNAEHGWIGVTARADVGVSSFA